MARRRRPRLFGSPHVVKLGGLIHPFSIPARKTCPGKSRFCESICYADTGFFMMTNVKRRHAANLVRTREESFVDDVVAEIKERYIEVARVHMAGDFYSAAYAAKWVAIVRRCPRTIFFGYTRSWNQDAILPVLAKLAIMPNMHLWFSTDHEMPDAPALPGVRIAYLLATDEDPARVPADQHLVFRHDERPPANRALDPRPMKRANGVLVCPYEQGVERQVKLTCSNCGICWTPERICHDNAQEEEAHPGRRPRRRSPRPGG
jgi:hypothetical protein